MKKENKKMKEISQRGLSLFMWLDVLFSMRAERRTQLKGQSTPDHLY